MESDRWEIVDIQNRYAQACDTRQWELLDDVFVEEVSTDYGVEGLGRALIVSSIRSYLDGCGPTHHMLGNYWAIVDGDRAQASCHIRAYHVGRVRPDLFYEMFGIYHDRMVRTSEGWRISYRRLEVLLERGTQEVLSPG